jgi:hypothetical protein
MGLLETPAAALAWIGRQGTRAVALSVFAGLALPWLAAAAKPAFTPSCSCCSASPLCVRMADLRGHVRRPGLVLAVLAWMMIATPLAAGLPIGRTYTLIATDCPAVWEARSCAWCWMMRSRKLLAAALVPALPAAGLVMVICEPSA